MMAQKSINLLSTTSLLLGNWLDSKKLLVRKNGLGELEFCNKNDFKEYGRSFLDFILNPQANYVVNVKLEQRRGQNKYFWFGLISDYNNSNILISDQTNDYDGSNIKDSEELFYSEYNGLGNINTQIKGQSIKTNDNSLEKRSLEMRINIQRKILKVGELPNYGSVVQIDKSELIQPSIPYRFFLAGLNTQTKITITKLETVSQFDYLM